ncbi:MAG: hypothetical protein KKA81_14790 [Bacteroidetes bacterium]|nr:hypothetical protein [Bacteroidota bacterium]
MKNIAKLISWMAGTAGGLLLLGGVIAFFAGGEFLGVKNHFNWFFVANSFFLLAICSQLFVMSEKINNKS